MNACLTASDTAGTSSLRPLEVAAEEVLHQHRDVLAALAQRRQRQRQHVEAVVQVLAELAFRRPAASGRAWCRR